MNNCDDFQNWLKSLASHPDESLHQFFAGDEAIYTARAPGRLDVMGGIADYSGSLVLETPITDAAFCAMQWQATPTVQIVSVDPADGDKARQVTIPLQQLNALCDADWEHIQSTFSAMGNDQWTAYVAGTMIVLLRDQDRRLDRGIHVLLRSFVPEGKGVSSSAAIEVATMRAFADAMQVELDGPTTATLCQLAENRVAGAPCGIMDQMTSACGKPGELLALLCQPAEIQGYRSIQRGLRVWGIDSGVRHAVGGSDYSAVRIGAFMGYRIIAELAGLKAETIGPGYVQVDDSNWHGYLANIPVSVFEKEFAGGLPETMAGQEFLSRYGGLTDQVTTVDPEKTYAVKQPTAHPVYEHDRVCRFAKLLEDEADESAPPAMGALMYESHASYSACGLGSDGTDALVQLVRDAGSAEGLFGAKITGGGSGGTVAVLARSDAESAIRKIVQTYETHIGKSVRVFEVDHASADA